MPSSRRFRVPDEVVSEVMDGEAVVLHLGTGTYFALNRTGTRIWQLLRETGDPERICQTVATEFIVDPTRARADFDALAKALLDKGLLRVEE